MRALLLQRVGGLDHWFRMALVARGVQFPVDLRETRLLLTILRPSHPFMDNLRIVRMYCNGLGRRNGHPSSKSNPRPRKAMHEMCKRSFILSRRERVAASCPRILRGRLAIGVICLLAASPAFAGSLTLATADTLLTLNADPAQPRVLSLASTSGAAWKSGSPQQLIDKALIDG